jgi:hypothetical protein
MDLTTTCVSDVTSSSLIKTQTTYNRAINELMHFEFHFHQDMIELHIMFEFIAVIISKETT